MRDKVYDVEAEYFFPSQFLFCFFLLHITSVAGQESRTSDEKN